MAVPVFASSAEALGTFDALPTLSTITPDAGSNRIAIVIGAWEHQTDPQDITAVSWAGAGAGFTKLGSVYNPNNTQSHNGVSVWYLLDTNFPAGAGDITVTVSDTSQTRFLYLAVGQITGAKQQAPDTLIEGPTAGQAVITTLTADSLLVEGFSAANNATITADTGQTVAQKTETATGGGCAALAWKNATTVQQYTEEISASSPAREVLAATAIWDVAASLPVKVGDASYPMVSFG